MLFAAVGSAQAQRTPTPLYQYQIVADSLNWTSIGDCDGAGDKIVFDSATFTFSCGTDNSSGTVDQTANYTWTGNHSFTDVLAAASTELTIVVGGSITVTQLYHSIDTYLNLSVDDLDSIEGGADGRLLILHSEANTRVPTVKHNQDSGTGNNILLAGDLDYDMDEADDVLVLLYDASADSGNGAWIEVSRGSHSHPWTDIDFAQNVQAGTSYNMVKADQGKLVSCSNAAGCTITIRAESVIDWTPGAFLFVSEAAGGGAVTIAAGAGVTLHGGDLTSGGDGEVFYLTYLDSDNWSVKLWDNNLTGGAAIGISAGAINVDTDGINATYIDETDAYTWTGAHSFSSLSATSPSLTSPTFLGKANFIGGLVDDDDCSLEQGRFWFDETDEAFEFCPSAAGGTPVPIIASGGSSITVTAATNTIDITDNTVGAAEIDETDDYTWTGDHDAGAGTFQIPNSTTLPATCEVGDVYMDTNATSGQRFYLCESANTWALQGDGGGHANGSNCSAGQWAAGVDGNGAAEGCTADDDSPDSDAEVPDAISIDQSGSGTMILDQDAAPAPTTEGQIMWETDDDHLIVGDGSASVEFVPAEDVSGDATMTDAGVVTVSDVQDATADTESADDNTTQVATTAFVQQEINGAGGTGLTCSGGTCNVDSVTRRVPILNSPFTNPASNGECFFEPYTIKATNDNWAPLVLVCNDTSTRDGIYGLFHVPQDYSDGADIVFDWTATATSGDVEFDFDYRCIGGNDAESYDQATAQETVNSNDTAPSAVNERMEVTIALTDGNLSAGDTCEFFAVRDGTDAGDTMSAAVIIFGIYFEYDN